MAKKPSIRAKRAAKILVENGGKSVADAMRDAGYSKATARNPQKLTGQKTWKELMEHYLPEEKVARVHSELLDAKDVYFANGKTAFKPDNAARNRAVDMALRLRGAYAPEQTTVIMRKFSNMSDEDLAAAEEEAERKLKKKS